jgi:colanic acid/amylovoran biosynthesis protein
LDADLDSRELRAVIGSTAFVVASRFHSMVSALATGVPPLTYGWGGHKYSEVLAQFNVTELGNSYNDLDIESFKTAFRAMTDAQADLRARIADALPRVLARNAQLPAVLAAIVER